MEGRVSKDWNGRTMNYKLIMDVAVLAGEIMLSSGAETYRVEDTMEHILRTSRCKKIEAFALMTGIVTTLDDECMSQPMTVVKTINDRATNLNHIIKVNEISRAYCGGRITLEEAYEKLKHVQEKQYSSTVLNVATALIATGFAMMLGGTMQDVLTATIVGLCLACCLMVGKKIRMNGIIVDVFSCMVMTLCTMGLMNSGILSVNMDIVIVSAIMPIVPGVAITNAIRDTLQGDYLSGCARILEAFLKAASIALGVGIGMAVFEFVAGGGLLWL